MYESGAKNTNTRLASEATLHPPLTQHEGVRYDEHVGLVRAWYAALFEPVVPDSTLLTCSSGVTWYTVHASTTHAARDQTRSINPINR